MISKNLCRIDYVDENIYVSQDIVYSCENNNIMQEEKKDGNDIIDEFKKNEKEFFFGENTFLDFSKKNSELDYMLQFKIIDEICVMGESNAYELKKYFEQIKNHHYYNIHS